MGSPELVSPGDAIVHKANGLSCCQELKDSLLTHRRKSNLRRGSVQARIVWISRWI